MMFFNHPQVRGHLLRRGRVYTIRDHRIPDGRQLLVHGSRFKNRRLGFGMVRLVKIIPGRNVRALVPYVRESGLPSASAWLAALTAFRKGRPPSRVYLYRVTRITSKGRP